nr:uncharacterized protein LOC115253969 isoform X1 [Aedes albopictus]
MCQQRCVPGDAHESGVERVPRECDRVEGGSHVFDGVPPVSQVPVRGPDQGFHSDGDADAGAGRQVQHQGFSGALCGLYDEAHCQGGHPRLHGFMVPVHHLAGEWACGADAGAEEIPEVELGHCVGVERFQRAVRDDFGDAAAAERFGCPERVHVFGYLEKWLLYKKDQLDKDPEMSEEERQSELVSTIEAVFAHVRFAMMSPAELANVLTCPIFRFHKEFFVERVAIGMCYHSGRDDRIREIRAQENGTLQFTPRLYTNDRWSLSMMIDEFEKIENYQNFVWCFFSQKHLSECYEDQSVAWEIELFPRGVKYNRAMLIGVFNMPVNTEIPESIIRTVRLKVLCQERLQEDQRFRIGVLISGVQNRITHIRTCHVRTAYFSNDFRVLNIDNLIPYDELQLSAVNLSPHLIGEKRDTIRLQVIIAPLGEYACTDMPTFEFKDL